MLPIISDQVLFLQTGRAPFHFSDVKKTAVSFTIRVEFARPFLWQCSILNGMFLKHSDPLTSLESTFLQDSAISTLIRRYKC